MRLGTVALCSSLLVVCGCNSMTAGDSSDGVRVMKDTKPEGSLTMTAEEMSKKEGVPIYPGAESPSGQSTLTSGVTETRYDMVMTTKDSIKQVSDFYKKKLPALNGGMNNGAADYLGMNASKNPLHLTIGAKDGKTTIHVVAIVESPPPKP